MNEYERLAVARRASRKSEPTVERGRSILHLLEEDLAASDGWQPRREMDEKEVFRLLSPPPAEQIYCIGDRVIKNVIIL